MSKRYSGKSFKDASVMKHAKLSLKKKRERKKKEKNEKNLKIKFFPLYQFLKNPYFSIQ